MINAVATVFLGAGVLIVAVGTLYVFAVLGEHDPWEPLWRAMARGAVRAAAFVALAYAVGSVLDSVLGLGL